MVDMIMLLEIKLFEFGLILVYLVEKFGKFIL